MAKSQYWTDQAYAEFYEMSAEEQRIVNRKLQDKPAHGPDSSQTAPQFGEEITNEQLLGFQRAFAEFSGGRETVKAVDVRRLFESVGVVLSAAQVREMLKESAPYETSPKPHYSELLHMYCKCMGAAVGSLERLKPSKASAANDTLDVTDVLLVDEAREYCIVAGVADDELEDLLSAHTSDGLVSLIGLDRDLKKMDAAGRLKALCLSDFDLGAELAADISTGTSAKADNAAPQASPPEVHAVSSQDVASSACSLEAAALPVSEEPTATPIAVANEAEDVPEEDDLAALKKQLEEAKAILAAKQEKHKNEIEYYKAELQKHRAEVATEP
eukprot:gnl/MRDRNA2_/MRDRNA2_28937_c0_seq1.p1 gnl/MRDRNA2_/MRDRNA2_28937_c0~~gnl/MRDRNA2_/MRDRNA2_28937_c0_seq1.p1  ORF type:complete len:329 (-),score=101.20 gnl/MRDRNA2_/MRDRNA2_28937_c0_seq1:197-1183(-)